MDARPRTIPFGPFDLIELIGTGGMAEIFRARRHDAPDQPELVIKKILPGLADDQAFIRMLIAEARVTAVLRHPNVVQIHELGAIDDDYYIAMELVEGADLLRVLARCTQDNLRIPPPIVLSILAEVCKGLAYAHAATTSDGRPLHIIHRDVSPSNILLSQDGRVKIMDFGVATADLGRTGPIELGQRGLKGKLGYMSPEQVLGQPMDRRSDIFALGVILFECLTLKRLFLGKHDAQTLLNIRTADIESKLALHTYIPDPLRDILRRALAADPNQRYATATDLQEALLDYLFDHHLSVEADDLALFLRQVFEGPPTARLREAQRATAPPPTPPATLPGEATPPGAPAAPLHTRPRRRVDLRRATFRLRHAAEPPFGPIRFDAIRALLRHRSVGPHEWVSINDSEWLRVHEAPALVDLNPALFADELARPLSDGPLNPLRAPHLLHRVARQRADGKLKLTHGTLLKEIYFRGGSPVAVQSNIKRELIGQQLIAAGRLDPATLDDGLRRAFTASIPLGQALQEAGHIGPDVLERALRKQLTERVLEFFTWTAGWYEFFAGVFPPQHAQHHAPVPVPHLITAGIRHHYSTRALHALIKPYLDRPWVHSGQALAQDAAIEAFGFTIDEARLYGHLLQHHSLRAAHDALPDADAGRGLATLNRVAFALHQSERIAFRQGG